MGTHVSCFTLSADNSYIIFLFRMMLLLSLFDNYIFDYKLYNYFSTIMIILAVLDIRFSSELFFFVLI